jgi:hypothetical protein
MKRKRYVYIIGQLDDGPVKIGITAHIKRRLYALQHAHPYKLVVLAKYLAEDSEETKLHELFKQYRLSGEWFERSPAIKEFIIAVRSRIPAEQRYETASRPRNSWEAIWLEEMRIGARGPDGTVWEGFQGLYHPDGTWKSSPWPRWRGGRDAGYRSIFDRA